MPLPYSVGARQTGAADPSLDTGGGLANMGTSVQGEANTDLQFAAASESNRNYENQQIEIKNKQGNEQLGGAIGGAAGGAAAAAEWGSAAGPYGAAVGGILGLLAGGLFNK
jgi:hypothetical protein